MPSSCIHGRLRALDSSRVKLRPLPAMRLIPPVTVAEFAHLLHRCTPPNGWPHVIAVANSGGPDSTALLFLLTAAVREQAASFKAHSRLDEPHDLFHFPRDIVSVHVNHDLQAVATAMEQAAVATATKLNVPFIVEMVSWGIPPFPAHPGKGVAGEKIAREARYYRLFAAMQRARADVIAFAHHADDQVETAIMRMSQGSSVRGLAGMRPVRRWGMGQRDDALNFFGAEGMSKGIVRPLLTISKDRLLATCEANGLDYVNDPTNFQPGITVRNAIRHFLASNSQVPSQAQYISAKSQTVGLQFDITSYVEELRAVVPDTPPSRQLKEAVRLYGIRLEEVEMRVTNILALARMPSPPSTILLNSTVLASVTNEDVRTALIRRCLRYISHGPWGSLWAEASGDRDVFRRIAREFWSPPDRAPASKRRQFTAGAGVTAIPVAINLESMQIRHRPVEHDKPEAEGWLLARAPPYEKAGAPPEPLYQGDVTDGIRAALRSGERVFSTLYDCRFVVSFNLKLLPGHVEDEIVLRDARVIIQPDTRWALPKVVLTGNATPPRDIAKFLWFLEGWQHTQKQPLMFQEWIEMDFIRSLNAI